VLKTELIDGGNPARMFEVSSNADIFTRMISFLRFVASEEDEDALKEAVEATIKSLGEEKFTGELNGSLSL